MSDEQKIVISSNEEKNFEKQIRPSLFDDFIGQTEIVESLKTYITAAKQREDALDHILLYGPPGTGKTYSAVKQNPPLDMNGEPNV